MLFRIRTGLALFAAAGSVLACAALAGIEDPSPLASSGSASDAADGAIQTLDGVTISPSELVLAPIKCGEGQSGTIAIANNGSGTVPYEVTLPRSSTFSLRGGSGGALVGTVARGQFVAIQVDAKGVLPGPQWADVVVKIGNSVHAINVKLDVSGAILGVHPAVLDFGEVMQNVQSQVVPVTLENDGNEQISVTGFSGVTSDFVFSKATVVVPAGGTASVDVYMTPGPAAAGAPRIEVRPLAGGTTCAAVPSLTLTGKRVNQEITVGPLSADLGDFDCGSTPSKQATITVTNYSQDRGATYEAKLASPSSRFQIVSGASGAVAAAASAQMPSKAEIVIGAKVVGVPLGEFDEDLEIDVSSLSGIMPTRIVKLHIGAYGAILEAKPTSLGGFAVNETKSFTLENVGNARTCLAYSGDPGSGFAIETDDALNPNEQSDLRVQLTAASSGNFGSNIQIARVDCPGVSAPLCVPSPSLAVSTQR